MNDGPSLLSRFPGPPRVWDCCILPHALVTVGEDAAVCVWGMDGKRLRRFDGHMGRGIWSVACSPDRQHVLTGVFGSCSMDGERWLQTRGRDGSRL